MADRRHEVMSSAGIAQLGGDDYGSDPAGVGARERARRLDGTEEALPAGGVPRKERRAPPEYAPGRDRLRTGAGGAGEVIVSTSDFHAHCRPLVEQTIAPWSTPGRGAATGGSWEAVAAIYVVGGASALPLVARCCGNAMAGWSAVPYPHAATAIGLAIAADQEAGYQLRERFTRHFGVWREAEDGHTVAFDVLFAKDSLLPAPDAAPLTCVRRYQPTHNIGHFRYLECSQLTTRGEPAGDLTPWDEVYFPFDPSLHTAGNLQALPITRMALETQWIEEHYACDAHGIIEVEMTHQTSHYACRYHLRGSVRSDPWG